jgi:hypothetical protein
MSVVVIVVGVLALLLLINHLRKTMVAGEGEPDLASIAINEPIHVYAEPIVMEKATKQDVEKKDKVTTVQAKDVVKQVSSVVMLKPTIVRKPLKCGDAIGREKQYRSTDNMRLFSREECALCPNSNFYSNGECLKKSAGGDSYSYDFRKK